MKGGKMLHAPTRFVSIYSTAFTPSCIITMGSEEIDTPRPRGTPHTPHIYLLGLL